MKLKLLSLILALICVFLCSCTEGGTPATTTTESQAQTTASITEDHATYETLSGVSNDDVNIVFISSGRSDAILIMTGGKAYMVDTGEKGKDEFKRINNILKIYNIKKIEGVFLSHTHKDHTGGLKRLSELYNVKCVYSASLHSDEDEIRDLTQSLSLEHKPLNAGDTVELSDSAYFKVIAPLSIYPKENNNSMVMMLYANGKRVLFTGDMEFSEEAELVDKKSDLKADILKVANHGNPDATSNFFLKSVSPDYAVICTDRKIDEDSANEAIIKAAPQTKFYITDEYSLGIFVNISKVGEISIETK